MIEILVVVAIISILAVIAIASYGTARQRAKMDYTADALVNLVNRQQNSARSGRQEVDASGAGEPVCYGVSFSKKAPYVGAVEAPYIAVDTAINPNDADFCYMEKSVTTPFEEFEDDKVVKIVKFGVEANELTLMFRPPEARISFGSEKPGFENDPKVTITFQSGNGKESRSFAIDSASGLAERVGRTASGPTTVRPSSVSNAVPNILNK